MCGRPWESEGLDAYERPAVYTTVAAPSHDRNLRSLSKAGARGDMSMGSEMIQSLVHVVLVPLCCGGNPPQQHHSPVRQDFISEAVSYEPWQEVIDQSHETEGLVRLVSDAKCWAPAVGPAMRRSRRRCCSGTCARRAPAPPFTSTTATPSTRAATCSCTTAGQRTFTVPTPVLKVPMDSALEGTIR